MIKKYFVRLKLLLLIFVLQALVVPWAAANIQGVYGQDRHCLPYSAGGENGYPDPRQYEFLAGPVVGCSLSSSGYVPHTGSYSAVTKVFAGYDGSTTPLGVFQTTSFILDATKSVGEQEINVTGPAEYVMIPGHTPWVWCLFLRDNETGIDYEIYDGDCGGGHLPLPPTPPAPKVSCTLNNGNALTVSLGTLDRAEIPTVANAGTATSLPFNVSCTGGDVSVSMKMNYAPITSGSGEAVKTSANGVGVAILYDGKSLSTTDTTTMTFLEGANNMNLAFQAVRDPAVELKDIPTGAFTANAVLEMTEQ